MERREYKSPVSAGELPLIAIDPVPENLSEYVSKDKSRVPPIALNALNNIMSKVAESGCNCILFGGTFEYMDNVLNYASDHNLKAIFQNNPRRRLANYPMEHILVFSYMASLRKMQ